MITLPNELVKDNKAKRIVERFISNIILECTYSIREIYADIHEDNANYTLADEIQGLFPTYIEYGKRIEYFETFEALLRDENEIQFGLLYEYIMNGVISRYIVNNEEIYCYNVTPNPDKTFDGNYLNIKYMDAADRKYVIKALQKEYSQKDVKEVMQMIEDMRLYKETCFYDHDFELLDEMSEDELAKNEINEILGIGAKTEQQKRIITIRYKK